MQVICDVFWVTVSRPDRRQRLKDRYRPKAALRGAEEECFPRPFWRWPNFGQPHRPAICYACHRAERWSSLEKADETTRNNHIYQRRSGRVATPRVCSNARQGLLSAGPKRGQLFPSMRRIISAIGGPPSAKAEGSSPLLAAVQVSALLWRATRHRYVGRINSRQKGYPRGYLPHPPGRGAHWTRHGSRSTG